ncbi:MAG: hypothetical protein BWY91_01162 [bacterium ADurb.BinA028]|nr:MAG: hypothetical protein BWY91_01162 [bacterium ADurb.BinA028]
MARAIAIMARWRIPPENSWGYWSTRRAGLGMPTRPSRSTALALAADFEVSEWCTRIASTICDPIV